MNFISGSQMIVSKYLPSASAINIACYSIHMPSFQMYIFKIAKFTESGHDFVYQQLLSETCLLLQCCERYSLSKYTFLELVNVKIHNRIDMMIG